MPDSGRFENGRHLYEMRVFYEDTDAGGIVYYANYLKYAERARTEALRLAGIGQDALRKEKGIFFVVRRAEVDYLAPARLDDILIIETELLQVGGASFTMRQRARICATVAAEMQVVIVCIDESMRPLRIPPFIREALLALFSPLT